MARLAALLMFLLALAACGRAPESSQVRQNVEARLSRVFEPGTFQIESFEERGSSAATASVSGEVRRVVYYETRLKLARDVDFGGWNTPGAASLVTVLGAGPKGIRGVKAGGNKAGDEISAFGTAIYQADGDAWQEVAPAGFTPPIAPALETISPPPFSERLLVALREVTSASPIGATPAGRAIIDDELSRSLAAIQARLSRLNRGYAIAAGPERGQYVQFVQALQAARPSGLNFQALLTAGSVENLTLLHQDQALLGLAQADVAHDALEGHGPFASQGPFPALRLLGGLYPELLHVIVRADSPARSVRDLTHKRISLGPAGSGTRITAERVLSVYGMERGRDFTADDAPLAAGIAGLEAGTVDAVIQVIGVPADEIRTAAAAVKLRLLPVDDAAVAKLTAGDTAVLRGTIANGTYAGVDRDVATVMVPALLVTTSSLAEAEAATLVKAIFGEKVDLLAAGSAQGGQLGAAAAQVSVSIPFAAGAQEALRGLQGQ